MWPALSIYQDVFQEETHSVCVAAQKKTMQSINLSKNLEEKLAVRNRVKDVI